MTTIHAGVASCLVACFGALAFADTPGATDRLTIRIDGIHEVLKGGAEKPLEIGIGNAGSARRGKLIYLTASFEGSGLDKKVPLKRNARDILGADRITLEVKFAHHDAKQNSIRVKGHLGPDKCCGKGLEGFLRVPEEARLGDVKITITWGKGKEVKGGSVTEEVSISEAK